jgi:prepilin-type N-terminal cleavage/methylation domain-containing protein
MPRLSIRRAFTLLEFLIVVAIVCVLVAIVFPRLMTSKLEAASVPTVPLAPSAVTPVAVSLRVGGKLPDHDEKVTFSVIEGGGSVNPTEVKTDSTGLARTTWTLGSAPGTRNALMASTKEGKKTLRIEVMTTGSPTITAPASDSAP